MLTWLRAGVSALAAIYLSGFAAAFGAIALGSARAGWTALLREMEFLLFAPLPVLLLLALALCARRAVVMLLVPFAVLALLYGPHLAPKAPAPAGGAEFRVLSFNVGAARGLTRPAAVVQAIRAANPDVVCLVETPGDLEATIGDALQETYPYRASSTSMFVFSRFPLTDIRTAVLRTGAKDSLHATLEVDHRLLSLTAVHLQRVDGFPGLRSGPVPLLRSARGFATDARDAAVREMMPLLRDEGGTRILVGDFNLTPTSQSHQILSAELQDAFVEAGWGLGHTYPTMLRTLGLAVSIPMVRIDYIFHSHDLIARRAWVGTDGGSDHLPVIADLAFR